MSSVLKPAKRDIDPDAKSHAGRHGDFEIKWIPMGWWIVPDWDRVVIGPFHTSQAAFGAVKDAIDKLLSPPTTGA